MEAEAGRPAATNAVFVWGCVRPAEGMPAPALMKDGNRSPRRVQRDKLVLPTLICWGRSLGGDATSFFGVLAALHCYNTLAWAGCLFSRDGQKEHETLLQVISSLYSVALI